MKQIIPDAALDKHTVLFGMTGAGKTSVIKTAIVEPDLEADRRVLIITPKDDWWGLRLSKTGKSAAYDIPIFGGMHEDYPLTVKDVELLADTYATMKGSAIFCTSRLSTQDRAAWFAKFADRLLMKNKGWCRVVIDEAHVFMPKQGGKGGGNIPKALHAGNELVSQGRSQGLRIVLASQRSAKLHNDASTQCSCMMAMLLMSPHDRRAVIEWIEDQADPEKGKEIVSSLSALKPGEAWVWAPGAKILDRIQFPRPSTFDSSAAADADGGEAPELKPINLDALKGKLATVEAQKAANDPKALKAENARLTAEIALMRNEPRIDDGAIQEAERRGYANGMAAGRRHIVGVVEDIVKSTKAHAAEAERLASKAWDETLPLKQPAPLPRPTPKAAPQMPPRAKSIPQNGDAGPLPKGELAVLIACAQANGASREQLTVMTGYKRSTRDAYIQRLAEKGFVTAQSGADIAITDDGRAALPSNYEPLPTGQELLQHYIRTLPKGESECLAKLADAAPLPRDAIGELTGFKRSTRDAYLQRLSTRRLITQNSGLIYLSDTLT